MPADTCDGGDAGETRDGGWLVTSGAPGAGRRGGGGCGMCVGVAVGLGLSRGFGCVGSGLGCVGLGLGFSCVGLGFGFTLGRGGGADTVRTEVAESVNCPQS